MSRSQFTISLSLAILFAILALWGMEASRTTGTLLAQQQALQGGIENARMQQKILEQILQRTAVIGREDPEILTLLRKYGIRVTAAPSTPAPPVPLQAAPVPPLKTKK